jgi:hypothetical protein
VQEIFQRRASPEWWGGITLERSALLFREGGCKLHPPCEASLAALTSRLSHTQKSKSALLFLKRKLFKPTSFVFSMACAA